MKNSRLFSYIALIASIAFVPFLHVSAVTISFDPQETTVGMSSPFLVGVTIDADTPINAVRAVIDIPESMEVIDASDGNSVINFWIERPHVIGHQLVFAGIIPGGFTGIRGKLITLTLKALSTDRHSFIIDPSSRVYESGPDATPDPIYTRPLALSVSESKDNIANPIPDSTPPEPFAPKLTQIATDEGSVWAVSFETQDKQSGIASFEVAETPSFISLSSKSRLEGLPWKPAESPSVLSDQNLASNIYIKATDKAGNERFESIPALHPKPWYVRVGGYILVVILALLILYAFKKFVSISLK